MTKSELLALADKYQQKADRNYDVYQETGAPRYDRERRNAEDLADAMRMAANAAEDHQNLIALRGQVVSLATEADKAIQRNATRDDLEKILRGLISYAAMSCHYQRSGIPERKED